MPDSVFGMGTTSPDFVMLGMPRPEGGVRLIASDKLSYAELRAEYRRQDVYWDYGDILPAAGLVTSYDIILSVHMGHLVIIDAPDYPTAFEELFKKWRPEQAHRKGIEPPHKAIKAGQGQLTDGQHRHDPRRGFGR